MSTQYPEGRDGKTAPTPAVHPPITQYQPSYANPQHYQSLPPLPKRTRKRVFFVILAVVVIGAMLVLGAYGFENWGRGSSSSQQFGFLTATAQAATDTSTLATSQAYATEASLTPQPTSTPATPTPQPTANPQGDVGVTQTSGPWQVTVNSVKTSEGDTYNTPKPGDYYIIINTTSTNTDTQAHKLSGIFFTLIDDQGNNYDETFLASAQKNYGDVVGGQMLRGDTVFEVPTSVTHFTLQFEDQITGSQIVQWNLSV